MTDRGRAPDEPDPTSFTAWAAGGYKGPPPWRRGLRPLYLVLTLALAGALGVVFWLAMSRRLP